MKSFVRVLFVSVLVGLFALVAYYLYDTLRERTTAEMLAEIIHIEDSRQITNALRSYLQHPDPQIRSRAALAVGRIGSPEAGRMLYSMVGDSSINVAAQAVFALGLTGEKEYAVRLADIAFDLPSAIGVKAIEAAGRLADSSSTDVIELLPQYLAHPSPEVREAVCMAAFRAGAKRLAPEIITMLATEPDELVRVAGLYALARMRIAEAEEVYVSFLADADPFVRALAVRGLGSVETEQSTHYLAIALNDSDRKVVAQAITELAKRDDKQALRSLVKKFESERDEKLIMELMRALQRQENDGGLARSFELLEDEPTDNIVISALKYITAIKKGRAVALIDSVLTAGNSRVRAACAEAYALVGDANVVPRLATLFNDEDSMVRRTALEKLPALDSNNIDFYLKKALNDRDFVVVWQAISHIKQAKLTSYLPVLNTMMSRGDNIDVDLRRMLVEAAGAVLEESPSDPDAMKILINGALDPEYIVRMDAVSVYKTVLEEDRSEMGPPARTRISESDIRSAIEKYETNPVASMITERGEIVIELNFEAAPRTVIHFIELANSGFYDGLSFHRIIPNFVAQGGDPRGDGWGGSKYFIRCEYSDEKFVRGTVGIATSGKDSGGSQFFFTLSPQPHLEGRYTVFAQVLDGMDVVDRLVAGDLIESVTIEEEPL